MKKPSQKILEYWQKMKEAIRKADFDQFFVLFRRTVRLADRNSIDTWRIVSIRKKLKKELRKSGKKRNTPQIKHLFTLIFREIGEFQALLIWDERMKNTLSTLQHF
jgi:hypothetical protein